MTAAPKTDLIRKRPNKWRATSNSRPVLIAGFVTRRVRNLASILTFLGPAAITLAHRYNLDSRDGGQHERMPLINSDNGAWGCTFVGYCSQVCPKGVDPAGAVNQGKVASTQDMVIAMFNPNKEGKEVTG